MRMDNVVPVAVTPATAQAPPPGSIASRWRELQGEGSWAGLLDPIDIDLRASVIAYGELAAAAYDGFNTERRSEHAGMCLYKRDELLTACGVSSPGHYKVTKFLFAPSGWVRPTSMAAKAFFVRPLREGNGWTEVNWMGYVAVATDEGVAALGRRDIVVVWRGTVERLEYFTDMDFLCQASADKVLGSSTLAAHKDAKVHRGFLAVYTSKDEQFPHNQTNVKGQVFEEVKKLMKLYKDEVTSITVTGHSLGAALATLNAVDMVANGINVPPASSKQPPCPVTAILFASPRVGNGGFKAALASFTDLRALNVRNEFDLVPSIPPSLPLIWYENNVGTAVMRINTSQSQHLRKSFGNSLRFWKHHNLEVYLHGIAGYHGAGKDFTLVVNRDVELVNKWADLLIDESLAPANWWIVQNKCMARDPADGHWKLMDFKEDGST